MQESTLRFITCGSVDDGKSTLIGRMLVDSKTVMQDQVDSASKNGKPDLSMFTDGLTAEREQGITIDVAYRYFATTKRKFVIGDTPGHEQYVRNMVTAASTADVAVILVDATKVMDGLLAQTIRHTMLVCMLRVPKIVFTVNKLDIVEGPTEKFQRISQYLRDLSDVLSIKEPSIIPVSALNGTNVVNGEPGWCGYNGPSLLSVLEDMEADREDHFDEFALPVQLVEKLPHVSTGSRRVIWGCPSSGSVKIGDTVSVFPSSQTAKVLEILDRARTPIQESSTFSVGLRLDSELDVSRGDWIVKRSTFKTTNKVSVRLVWLDNEPFNPNVTYRVLHGRRWLKGRVEVLRRFDISTMKNEDIKQAGTNDIVEATISLNESIFDVPYILSRELGSMILVDSSTNRTVAAIMSTVASAL